MRHCDATRIDKTCYVDNTVVLLIEVALVGQEGLQGQVSSGPCGKHDGPGGPSVVCGPSGPSAACGPSGMLMCAS